MNHLEPRPTGRDAVRSRETGRPAAIESLIDRFAAGGAVLVYAVAGLTARAGAGPPGPRGLEHRRTRGAPRG